MSEGINWSKLYAQGRCKAIGVSWTEEEAVARSKGVSAEDIRSGAWKPGEAKVETPEPVDVNQSTANTTTNGSEPKKPRAKRAPKVKK